MKKKYIAGTILLAALWPSLTSAQDKNPKKFGKEFSPCGTVEYETYLRKKNPVRNGEAAFEQWIAPKVKDAKRKQLQKDGNVAVTIPVVFHIIHDGKPVGVGENIPDAQILSQIEVLNEDFRRTEGTNGHNTNPVSADMEINFCLAKQDPAGFLTSGIVRYSLGHEYSWTMEEVEVLKTQTQWDPEKYLNIWVVNDMDGVGGYAQFPTGSGLEGLEGGSVTTANTDGIVLIYRIVGSVEKYPEGDYQETNDLGKVATHEIGHWLGLRHIWGDAMHCAAANDYCDDTPTALTPTNGCPVAPKDSCPVHIGNDMIENYMDYSGDACKNVFTQDQKDRMLAVLANSPRRANLPVSDGCTPGIAITSDASLQIRISGLECGSSTIHPELVLSNVGAAAFTSATIKYSTDDTEEIIYEWNGNLAPGESTVIVLPTQTLVFGEHVFNADIDMLDGSPDPADYNDNRQFGFTILGRFTTSGLKITLQTDNNGDETGWGIYKVNPFAFIAGSNNPMVTYENNQLYTIDVPISQTGCYIFEVYDNSGNGMCCENGNGYFRLETNEGELIAEGGDFTYYETISLYIDNVAGTDSYNKLNTVKLHPNPASNMLNITAIDALNVPESYIIYNSLGQMMDIGAITGTTQSVDIAKYANGVYFVKLVKDADTKTLQFIKH